MPEAMQVRIFFFSLEERCFCRVIYWPSFADERERVAHCRSAPAVVDKPGIGVADCYAAQTACRTRTFSSGQLAVWRPLPLLRELPPALATRTNRRAAVQGRN
jgi:hypothetical protein